MRTQRWKGVSEVEIGESFVIDDPENRCFGCSPFNPRGLAIEFVRLGEHRVEVSYRADPELCGPPEVVHGGIQATLLDETMGVAAQTAFPGEQPQLVTAEFSLRYRAPVLAATLLTIRGELVGLEGRDVRLRGAILNPRGERLTVAEARWRRID